VTLMQNRSLRFEIGALSFLLMVAVAVGYLHMYHHVDVPALAQRLNLHREILAGTADSPYRYRVLAPVAAEFLTRIAQLWTPDPTRAFALGFRWFDLLAVWGSLVAAFWYFREFFTEAVALGAASLTGALMLIPLRDHFYQPWSLLEIGLLALGLVCIRRRWLGGFLLVVFLAALNREAAVLLVVAAGAGTYAEVRENPSQDGVSVLRKVALWAGSALVVWGATMVSLRLLRGPATHVESVVALWARNTEAASLERAAVSLLLFLGPLWVLAVLGWRRSPSFVRWTAAMVPLQVALFAVFSLWHETRVLMPLYLVAIPLSLAFVFGGFSESNRGAGALRTPTPGARTRESSVRGGRSQ